MYGYMYVLTQDPGNRDNHHHHHHHHLKRSQYLGCAPTGLARYTYLNINQASLGVSPAPPEYQEPLWLREKVTGSGIFLGACSLRRSLFFRAVIGEYRHFFGRGGDMGGYIGYR
jgi:hypothetical protein